jgi:transposase-like protein
MFSERYYQDPEAAREKLESLLWPEGPVCPHCGCTGNTTKLQGAKHRAGVHKCNDCRKQFTVTVGTVFERSHVPLHLWFQVVYLMSASKKGISSHQIHRMIGVTYETAWFMTHRIREAMDEGAFAVQLGGNGDTVEVDETYWGNVPGMPKRHAWHHKEKIVSLVERNGSARSFHVDKVNIATLRPMMVSNIARDSRIVTDNSNVYDWTKRDFAGHESVNHLLHEYVRGDVTTNTVEGFFSILKRGLVGTFHHVGRNHLNAYLNEFDFRYNTRGISDWDRTQLALKGIAGKRLRYHDC